VRRPLVALALAAALAGAFPAGADPAQPSDEDPNAPATPTWEQRLEQAQTQLVLARTRVAETEGAVTRARHRRYPRGKEFDGLVATAENARKQLRAAEAELPALLEEARRAGVEPGVLRRFEPEEE
jgi:hypothetical protein